MAEIVDTDTSHLIDDVWIDVILEETFSHVATVTDHPVETGTDISDHVHLAPERLTMRGIVSNAPIRVPKSHGEGAAALEAQQSLQVDPDGPDSSPSPIRIEGEPESNAVLGIAQSVFFGTGIVANALGVDTSGPKKEFLLQPFEGAGRRTGKGSASFEGLQFTSTFDRCVSVDQALTLIHASKLPIAVYTMRRSYEAVVIETYDVEPGSTGKLEFTITAKVITTVNSEVADVPKPKQERGKPKKNSGTQQAQPAKQGDGPQPSARASTLYKALN